MASKNLLLHSAVLTLLTKQLRQLALDHFFSDDLKGYIGQLQEVLIKLEVNHSGSGSDLPGEVQRVIMESVWRATQYLAGSTSNRIPYEIVYALKHALEDWGLKDCVITTSLLKSSDFHCERINASPNLASQTLLGAKFKVDLVQVAFPEIFVHSPIFCSPLYHEIGHYVEERKRFITGLAAQHADTLLASLPDRDHISHYDAPRRRKIFLSHSIEHFCDLFAASYIGECAGFYINQWAPDETATETHPSTASRIQLIRSFLADEPSHYIDSLRDATKDSNGVMLLQRRFRLPSVDEFYSDIRPCEIQSTSELHGILPASLSFLERSIDSNTATLNKAFQNKDQIAVVINDLIEKSIRNFMIKRAWNEHMDETKN